MPEKKADDNTDIGTIVGLGGVAISIAKLAAFTAAFAAAFAIYERTIRFIKDNWGYGAAGVGAGIGVNKAIKNFTSQTGKPTETPTEKPEPTKKPDDNDELPPSDPIVYQIPLHYSESEIKNINDSNLPIVMLIALPSILSLYLARKGYQIVTNLSNLGIGSEYAMQADHYYELQNQVIDNQLDQIQNQVRQKQQEVDQMKNQLNQKDQQIEQIRKNLTDTKKQFDDLQQIFNRPLHSNLELTTLVKKKSQIKGLSKNQIILDEVNRIEQNKILDQKLINQSLQDLLTLQSIENRLISLRSAAQPNNENILQEFSKKNENNSELFSKRYQNLRQEVGQFFKPAKLQLKIRQPNRLMNQIVNPEIISLNISDQYIEDSINDLFEQLKLSGFKISQNDIQALKNKIIKNIQELFREYVSQTLSDINVGIINLNQIRDTQDKINELIKDTLNEIFIEFTQTFNQERIKITGFLWNIQISLYEGTFKEINRVLDAIINHYTLLSELTQRLSTIPNLIEYLNQLQLKLYDTAIVTTGQIDELFRSFTTHNLRVGSDEWWVLVRNFLNSDLNSMNQKIGKMRKLVSVFDKIKKNINNIKKIIEDPQQSILKQIVQFNQLQFKILNEPNISFQTRLQYQNELKNSIIKYYFSLLKTIDIPIIDQLFDIDKNPEDI